MLAAASWPLPSAAAAARRVAGRQAAPRALSPPQEGRQRPAATPPRALFRAQREGCAGTRLGGPIRGGRASRESRDALKATRPWPRDGVRGRFTAGAMLFPRQAEDPAAPTPTRRVPRSSPGVSVARSRRRGTRLETRLGGGLRSPRMIRRGPAGHGGLRVGRAGILFRDAEHLLLRRACRASFFASTPGCCAAPARRATLVPRRALLRLNR